MPLRLAQSLRMRQHTTGLLAPANREELEGVMGMKSVIFAIMIFALTIAVALTSAVTMLSSMAGRADVVWRWWSPKKHRQWQWLRNCFDDSLCWLFSWRRLPQHWQLAISRQREVWQTLQVLSWPAILKAWSRPAEVRTIVNPRWFSFTKIC